MKRFDLDVRADPTCDACDAKLTPNEVHYYGNRCEFYEQEYLERLKAWKGGVKDIELDKLYGIVFPLIH